VEFSVGWNSSLHWAGAYPMDRAGTGFLSGMFERRESVVPSGLSLEFLTLNPALGAGLHS